MIAGAGDELQGIKRGIMEMADVVAINKADGLNVEKAQLAKIQYKNALHLFPAKDSGWEPGVMTCSAMAKTGIAEIWQTIQTHHALIRANGFFEHNRNLQARYWMFETINEQLRQGFYNNPDLKPMLADMEQKVLRAEVSSFEAARQLLEIYHARD
jgi:LAO/AO transport system kinase